MARKKLEGVRVAALAADGFEQVELTSPLKELHKQGAKVDVISLRPGSILGMNVLFPGKKVPVDHLVYWANPQKYDALLLPGGFINPDFLRQSKRALKFVRAFDEARKPIAVICHGPWVLASAGLVRGRRLTSWPGIKDDLINAGAQWMNKSVVRDDNLVSSRGPQDLWPFKKAMVKLFAERSPAAQKAAAQGSSWTRLLWFALLLAGVVLALRRVSADPELRERVVRALPGSTANLSTSAIE